MNLFLLARPSALIVEKMKKLVESVGAFPLPLNDLREIEFQHKEDIEAIVVSTALSSPVKESYTEVIDHCWKIIGKKPTFLASYADLRRTKIIAESKFRSHGMKVTLLSLSEASESIDEHMENPVFIITYEEIANPNSFLETQMALKTILGRYHAITA